MNYYEVFTPAAPPNELKLLVGRDKDIANLTKYLNSPGVHPIVVGPRGIGKTSLVQHVFDRFNFKTQIEANTVKSFDELGRCICDDLEIEEANITNVRTEENSGVKGKGKAVIIEGELSYNEKSTTQTKGLSDIELSPQQLKRVLQKFDKARAYISIDELDDPDVKSDVKKQLAKFTKMISNQAKWFDHKFVFSGIGKEAHDLFGEHLSSNRNIPVIYLKRISRANFMAFFNEAERKIGIKIPYKIKQEVSSDADGFPYYIHQIGFHLFSAFEDDPSSTKLSLSHYKEARKRAFNEAFNHLLKKYKFTVYALKDNEKEILRLMVLSKSSYLPFEEVLKELSFYKKISNEEVRASIRTLYDKEYLRYRKSDKVLSLAEPLLKPFLKLKLKIDDDENQMRIL